MKIADRIVVVSCIGLREPRRTAPDDFPLMDLGPSLTTFEQCVFGGRPVLTDRARNDGQKALEKNAAENVAVILRDCLFLDPGEKVFVREYKDGKGWVDDKTFPKGGSKTLSKLSVRIERCDLNANQPIRDDLETWT